MSIDSTKYVILDVETNGLSSIRDDLLSISLYKPDTGLTYNRFLPLDLNSRVLTTEINGITTSDLAGLEPLSQDEVDSIIEKFELTTKTILTYGNLDSRFIKKYFERNKLKGYEVFSFYNFKHDIISSRFSEGNITKDNLCRLFGIPNVTDIHSGLNDCILEWKKKKKLNGKKLLITNNKVFFISEDYYIPVSYLREYPNFRYFASDLPVFDIVSKQLKKFSVYGKDFKKFPTNFDGMIIEHLINSMLSAEKVDSTLFLIKNKSKCQYIGKLPSEIETLYFNFNPNGTISAVDRKDIGTEIELNTFLQSVKKQIKPLITYIQEEIFCGRQIISQELVTHNDYRVMALCDLSTKDAVLEIKTNNYDPKEYKEQLFYQAKGRKCYLLQVDWDKLPTQIDLIISEICFPPIVRKHGGLREEIKILYFQERIPNKELEIIHYKNRTSPITVRCKKCNYQWEATSYYLMNNARCPNCEPIPKKDNLKKEVIIERKTKEMILAEKEIRYREKLLSLSNNKISAHSFQGSNKPVEAVCLICNYNWSPRADHLLARPWCPVCKRRQRDVKK